MFEERYDDRLPNNNDIRPSGQLYEQLINHSCAHDQ